MTANSDITKIIACADIHIPSFRGLDDLKEILQNFLNQCKTIVEQEEDSCKVRIAVLGDIFHNKIDISNESIIVAHWFLSELGKIAKTVVIAGNHDMLMNNSDRTDSITPIFEIGNMKNVIYLDKELEFKSGCYKDGNVVWCLFSSFDAFRQPDVPMFKARAKNSENLTYVGLIHGGINGAITPTNYVTENGLDPNVFENCDFVMAGHIHKKQELKKNGVKIVYCSSISQKDFGETITGHGYVLWDISDKDNYTYQYKDVENPKCGFYKFSINDIDDIKNDEEELINY